MKKVIFGVCATLMLAGATVFASNNFSKKSEKASTCCCDKGKCTDCSDCTACVCVK